MTVRKCAQPELLERRQQHEQRWNYFQHLSHFVIRKGNSENEYVNKVITFLLQFRVKSQSFQALKDVFQIRKWKGELLSVYCTQYLTLTVQRPSDSLTQEVLVAYFIASKAMQTAYHFSLSACLLGWI